MNRFVIAVLRSLRKDESGATAIEYVVLSAIVAAGLVVGASTLKNGVNISFNHVAAKVRTCNAGAC
jgi:pilus assembly protein Flp/PilA